MNTRPMSKSQLAEQYGISVQTLHSWIRRAGLVGEGCLFTESEYKYIRIFTPLELSKIYEALGEP